MSDRGVFVTAFLTAIFIVAAAFVLPQFFLFELAKSTLYVAIAVLVFFGEDRYSYMLGIIAPPLWFIVDILGGIFFRDLRVLLDYLGKKGIAPLETPLHAFARLAAVLLFILSFRAWRKEVPERLLGKTFWTCLVISLVYVGILTGWYLRLFPSGRTPQRATRVEFQGATFQFPSEHRSPWRPPLQYEIHEASQLRFHNPLPGRRTL